MNLPAGLTCGRCAQPLYPATARRADYGWVHAEPCSTVCVVGGCNHQRVTRGWCHSHYRRVRLYGDPLAGPRSTQTIAERLEDVQWMSEHGEHLDGAARRVGLTQDGLRKLLQRAGERDLLATLVARLPHDHNAPANREAVVRAKREQAAA